MATRSTVLARGQFAGKLFAELGIVPTGFTWIVKSVAITNYSGVDSTVSMLAQNPDRSLTVYLFTVQVQASQSTQHESWFVMEQGDWLFCEFSAGPVACWVSGAELPA